MLKSLLAITAIFTSFGIFETAVADGAIAKLGVVLGANPTLATYNNTGTNQSETIQQTLDTLSGTPSWISASTGRQAYWAASGPGGNSAHTTSTVRLFVTLPNIRYAALRACMSGWGNVGSLNAGSYESKAANSITYGPLRIERNPKLAFNSTTPWFPVANQTTPRLQLLFPGGSSNYTITPGTYKYCTDPLYQDFMAGESIYLWYYTSTAGTGIFNTFNGVRNTYYDSVNNGAFSVTSTQATSSTTVSLQASPVSNNGTSLLPLTCSAAAPVNITGPGITGTATSTDCATVTGTGVTSGTVNATTGAISMLMTAAQSGTYTIAGFGAPTGTDETATGYPSDMSSVYQSFPAIYLEGLPAYGNPNCLGVGIFGTSIITGVGNTIDVVSFADFGLETTAGVYSTAVCPSVKVSQPSDTASGYMNGYIARMSSMKDLRVSLSEEDFGTNDLVAGSPPGMTLMNILRAVHTMADVTASGSYGVVATGILPRTTGNSTTPITNFGPGAVTSGSLLSYALPATTAGQTSISVTIPGAPFLAGGIFGMNAANSTAVNGEFMFGESTSAGGTDTLTGIGEFSSGTFNQSTGVLNITLSTALPTGTIIYIYDDKTSTTTPSWRNYLNMMLCKSASDQADGTLSGPLVGSYGHFVDTPATIEGSPGTCTGSGNGQWASAADTYDNVHPSYAGHILMSAPMANLRLKLLGE